MKFVVTTFISVINQSIAHLMSWPIIILHFSKKFPGRNFYQNWVISNKSGSFDDPHSSSQPTFGYNQHNAEIFFVLRRTTSQPTHLLVSSLFLHSTQPFSTNVACGIKNKTHKTEQHSRCVGWHNMENGKQSGVITLLRGNKSKVYILPFYKVFQIFLCSEIRNTSLPRAKIVDGFEARVKHFLFVANTVSMRMKVAQGTSNNILPIPNFVCNFPWEYLTWVASACSMYVNELVYEACSYWVQASSKFTPILPTL